MQSTPSLQSATYRTLDDLPAELIHVILSHLYDETFHRWPPSIRACSLTCRYLRNLALEHFPKAMSLHCHIRSQDSVEQFARFIQRHPYFAANVATLTYHGVVGDDKDTVRLDDTVVASVIKQLPNLDSWRSENAILAPRQTTPIATGSAETESGLSCMKIPLRNCTIRLESGQQRDSSFVTFLRILDLFDMDGCYIFLSHCSDYPAPFLEEPELAKSHDFPCRIRCRSLSFNSSLHTTSGYSTALATLSSYLDPSILRMFQVSAASSGDLEAIGKVLSGPGREITLFRLALTKVTHSVISSHWPALRIDSCAKLERIEVAVTLPDGAPAPGEVPFATPLANILSHTPSSLQEIWLFFFCEVPADAAERIHDRATVNLEAIDEALCPGPGEATRHPNLKFVSPNFRWRPVDRSRLLPLRHAAVEETFRGLHQRGVLRYMRLEQESEYPYE